MLLYGEEKSEKIGQLRCDFIPIDTGTHKLLAYYGDVIFDKCPLTFQIYNAAMVTILETNPVLSSKFSVNDTLTITYDCSRCGPGFLDISAIVLLASGNSSTVQVEKRAPNKQGKVKCNIELSLPGKYIIDASYNDEFVKEVKINLQVHPTTEGIIPKISSTPKMTRKSKKDYVQAPPKQNNTSQKPNAPETVDVVDANHLNIKHNGNAFPTKLNNNETSETGPVVFGAGLLFAETGKVAIFTVDPKEKSGQLMIDVKGPKSLAKCLIRPEPESSCYSVEYYPNDTGLYIITVLWNDVQIPGSPFNVTVTDPTVIRCINYPDIFENTLFIVKNKQIQIDFDYSKVKSGKLSASMKRDHNQTILKCWSNTTKKTASFFVESKSDGAFTVDVFWNDVLQGEVVVQCQSGTDVTDNCIHGTNDNGFQVILKGHGMKEAYVGEVAEFIVDTLNAGCGKLNVDLSSTVHMSDKIPVKIVHLVNGEYRCSYMSDIPGDFFLTISWGKKTVKGSPFPVKIISKLQTVLDDGNRQLHGFVGEETFIELNIDLPLDNDDLLAISCIGKNGNSIMCYLEKISSMQYQVKLIADKSGKCQLNILYNQVHINGSPFSLRISDHRGISKIIVKGPGLLSTPFNKIDSRFTVDTLGAGSGRLTVQVRGPQESFRVEVQKNADNERQIQCSYNPLTIGEYIITVSWNSSLTRGSPFHILLT